MSEGRDIRIVLPSERSPMAAFCGGLAAVAAGALAVAFALDEGLSMGARWTALVAGGLVALSLGAGASRLWRARGGVLWDTAGSELGIGLTQTSDVLWVPSAEIDGFTVDCLQHHEDVEPIWSLLVQWRGHAELLLLEGPEEEDIIAAMEHMVELTGIVGSTGTESSTPLRAGRLSFGVQRGFALRTLLGLFGLALLLVGAILVPQYREQPVFAIFFGPVLVFLGGTILALDFAKRWCWESLGHDGGLWSHGFRFGSWRWGERTVSIPQPRWVLRPLGLKGAHLELVGSRELLVMGSGATTSSQADVRALCRLPEAFREGAPEIHLEGPPGVAD